ncbi:MAG: hypothetical protein ACXWV8_06040 [Chitinophagaceae bacterium]
MRQLELYADKICENGIAALTDDYDSVCYNIETLKSVESMDDLPAKPGNDSFLEEVFTAGRFLGVVSIQGKNNTWHIEFIDVQNDEKKAIAAAVKYNFETGRKFMTAFNKLSETYERQYTKFRIVIGKAPVISGPK